MDFSVAHRLTLGKRIWARVWRRVLLRLEPKAWICGICMRRIGVCRLRRRRGRCMSCLRRGERRGLRGGVLVISWLGRVCLVHFMHASCPFPSNPPSFLNIRYLANHSPQSQQSARFAKQTDTSYRAYTRAYTTPSTAASNTNCSLVCANTTCHSTRSIRWLAGG